MSQRTQTQTANSASQYRFDQILVASTGSRRSAEKLVHPSSLCFDKKAIYAGNNANWRLAFKDLDVVEQSIIERDVYGHDDDDDDGSGSGSSSRHRGRGRERHNKDNDGTSSETMILSLSGRKTIALKCTASTGGLDARAAHQLETFVANLKKAHRKAKMKNNGKDPYASQEKTEGGIGSGSRSASTGGSRTKAFGQRRSASASRVTMVTPHAHQRGAASLYLSPAKKRTTSGRFQSPARRRSSSSSIGGDQHQHQHSHYDPYYSASPNKKRNGSISSTNATNAETVGNVVQQSSERSPARRLNLPPKSPRNATPTKLRSSSIKRGGRKLRSVTNQLSGISGGNIKLRKRVDDAMFAEDSGDEDEFDDGKSQSLNNQLEEEEKEPDAADVHTRRRLKKAFNKTTEEEDSDVEFDDADVDVDANLASCKKKLKLSLEDDDDEEEVVESKKEESSTEREAPDANKQECSEKEAPREEGATESPASSPQAEASNESTKPQSTADMALTPSPAKKKKAPAKKGSIASFFAAKPSAKSSKKASKRSSPPDTYGAILSTPSKKARFDSKASISSFSSPATPQCRIDSSKPTPVSKQTQRKTSRYFGNAANAADNSDEAPKYSSGEEGVEDTTLTDYQHDDNTGHHDQNDHSKEDANSRYKSTFKNLNNSSQRPGRRVGYGRSYGSRLGQSRLAQGLKQPPSDTRSNHRLPVSYRLDFSGQMDNASSSTADAALGRTRKTWDKTPPLVPIDEPAKDVIIPGIQNLGNTCYLSASLQTLFSIPQFIADLYTTYEKQSTQFPTKNMPLTQSLLEVAVAIGVLKEEDAPLIEAGEARSKLLNSKAGNPAALKRHMDVLTDKFAGYEQRDAHEFLSDLVDFLHDELEASPPPAVEANSALTDGTGKEEGNTDENKNPNESAEKKESGEEKKDVVKPNAPVAAVQHGPGVLPTDKYFRLNVRVCLECDACGYSRTKDEMYRHLSVDVGEDTDLDKWTVKRSLKQFFQPEKRELKCEKCSEGKTATQKMEIISCPKALLLHFKRFIVTQEVKGSTRVRGYSDGKENEAAPPQPRMEMVLRKNKAMIPLEESLSIDSFVGKNEKSLSGEYHLRSVVHHVGSTAFSGHYTNCAKRITLADGDNDDTTDERTNNAPADNWVLFDDRVGTKKDMNYVAGNERNQRNCYMALYELK